MITKEKCYVPPIMFHPGVILAEKLAEMQMPVKEFALRCHKPEKTVHDILKAGSSITPDMAVLFENVLKIPARFWLKAQRDYDEYMARKRQEAEIQKSLPWAKNFPFSDMVKRGYISAPITRSLEEKVKILLDFFGIAKIEAWDEYFERQTLSTVFRISLAGVENKYSLSAWLRYGENIVSQQQRYVESFSMDKLKNRLNDLIALANSGANDFKEQLKKICAEIGIVLVYTPHIKNSKAQGATRWIGSTPLVQISDCRRHYDIFWFSFFHEICHILNHNKKDIFLEGIDYADKDNGKEKEADAFAASKLVPRNVEDQLRNITYSEYRIKMLSKQTGIHPAFLVGRMQYLGLIRHSYGNALIPSVQF